MKLKGLSIKFKLLIAFLTLSAVVIFLMDQFYYTEIKAGIERSFFQHGQYAAEQMTTESLARETFREKIKLLCFLILIVIALASVFTNYITYPVRILAKGIEIIHRGDLDHRVRVVSHDEIGELGRAFNEMVARLQSFNEELGLKVKEQTKKLQEALCSSQEKNESLRKAETELKAAMFDLNAEKEKIVENETKIRAIIDTIADALIVINEKGTVDDFNLAAERVFGYKAVDIKGKNIKILMPSPYREEHDGYLERYLKTGEKRISHGTPRELVGEHKDGWVFPIELTVREMKLNDRRLFVGVVRDITERKKRTEQLRLQAKALSAAANMIVITAPDGKIQWVNPAFSATTGWTLEEAVGQTPRVIRSGKQDAALYKDMWNTIKSGQVWRGEMINRRKDGREYDVELTITPMIDEEDGEVVAFIAISQDITLRKQFEKRLQEQKQDLEMINQELDSFVYTASHDLRAPLRGISSFTNFLEEDYKDKLDAEGKDYLNEIRKGAELMSGLLEDLLTLSRVARIHNPFEEVSTRELIDKAIEQIKHDIQTSNAEVIIHDPMPVILCDRIKLFQVFLNLISNGIKFSSKIKEGHPKIEIGYKDLGNFHEFFVKDNGIGIAPEHHGKVFKIFKRLHTAQEYPGTGAGLTIVEKIITQVHKGSIRIDSDVGKGAAFYFTVAKDLQSKKKIGEILVEEGLITVEDLEKGLKKQGGNA